MKIIEKIIPKTGELKKGEKAFFQKKYDRAATIFKYIIETSKDPTVKNAALYNLACTKLITSKNKTDTIKAMKMIEKWHSSKESKIHFENPLVLLITFQEIFNFEEKERLKSIKMNKKNDTIVKDKEKRIIELEQMIKTLQHQILELENIDQTIQEKRQTN